MTVSVTLQVDWNTGICSDLYFAMMSHVSLHARFMNPLNQLLDLTQTTNSPVFVFKARVHHFVHVDLPVPKQRQVPGQQ